MTTNQFIIAIVINIISAIIIWAVGRLIRWTRNRFTKGTIPTRVRAVFNAKTITIVGSLLIALFNLWILIKFLSGRSSFTRFELFVSIMFSLIIFFWTNRLIAVFRTPLKQELQATQKELGEARAGLLEVEQRAHAKIEETRREAEKANERAGELEIKAAKAEVRLHKLRMRQLPRTLDGEKFLAALKGKPTGVSTIVYPKEEREAAALALQIFSLMQESGWKLLLPQPISLSEVPFSRVPRVVDPDGETGISVMTSVLVRKKMEDEPFAPNEALANALSASGFSVSQGPAPLNEGITTLILVWPRY